MLSKNISAALALAFLVTASHAQANDQHLMVHYGCDAAHNRLTVKTFVSDEVPFETGRDNLSYIWLNKLGMSMECPFESGDSVYVKSYYGDSTAYGYTHVAIYVNNMELDRRLEFKPDGSQSIRITGDKKHNLRVTYSKK